MYLKEYNVRSGLRFTLTKYNLKNLPQLFDFVKEYEIERVCFYHLVPVGRGSDISHLVPGRDEIRDAMTNIIEWTEKLTREGRKTEVLTVDNHADNVFLYLRKRGISEADAKEMLEKIKSNGGAKYSSGVGIACIDAEGNVHPDQFWPDVTLGNVRDKTFSEIWTDKTNLVLTALRDRTQHIKGRCRKCQWLELCGGGLRSRAYAHSGDSWSEDPGCYLSDEECFS